MKKTEYDDQYEMHTQGKISPLVFLVGNSRCGDINFGMSFRDEDHSVKGFYVVSLTDMWKAVLWNTSRIPLTLAYRFREWASFEYQKLISGNSE